MEKIINLLINDATVGVDRYVNNGSTWLIFTNTKQWVIELTEDGTLWYNYYFFHNLFVYTALDVVENQHYITKWVEDNIINWVKETNHVDVMGFFNNKMKDTIQNGVKDIKNCGWSNQGGAEDAIQNGVKKTHSGCDLLIDDSIEDTIQNGVNLTTHQINYDYNRIQDTIENGVKETRWMSDWEGNKVEDAIQNGVKHTEYGDWEDGDERLDDIINNGVKLTQSDNHHRRREVVLTLRDGIKETHDDAHNHKDRIDGVIKNGIKEISKGGIIQIAKVDFVIDNGIKEVLPLPEQSGQLRGYGDYYDLKEDRTKPFTEYVKEVIENGEKI